ncbi:MAG: hypothetical protein V4613_10600 [Bacteroidota bacterium]
MLQNWNKLGLIFNPNKSTLLAKGATGYAAVPVMHPLNDKGLFRIFFSARDNKNRSVPFYIDYDMATNSVLAESDLLFEPGEMGCFDDSGIMPTSVIEKDGLLYLFYIGWNLGVTVPFRNSIGIATSADNGKTFTKLFKGPVIDRNHIEPHFVASNCIIRQGNQYIIYYLSCTGWDHHDGNIMHHYHIKWATSQDLIHWERNNNVAIEFKYENEYAISVPRVIEKDGKYCMWYSYRGGPFSDKYRIGYAESADGFNWDRKDELVNLSPSTEGWDSEMVCYPFVFNYNNRLMMLYNGNAYGKTGIGLAELEQ